ncbi:RDD family protein [Laribacter hongkongensis]|uniref:RDD family protein n=1 Tax=Laribacter hongkongensis TaxID=168471 RepID=UPI001EFEC472|nr:RDD family protein [Laribacter hongkongensis]MCG9032594.1 RDD family protein [Laribacter hongkongensis]MCG9066345.1 RDD family protein [Laribacter hongkongensis]MCG9092470.1 RDD family protein [Laribacter hongkongensis]MCG9095017.1 RDD family protein [Laribacter hongkongensis]
MTLPADTLPAGRLRRIGSLAYDALLLIGVLFVAGLLFQPLFLWLGEIPWLRVVYQLYLAVIVYAYFGWCWTRGGQTLAMKTWKIALVRTVDGGRPDWRHALLRLVLAALFYAPLLPAWTWVHYQPDLAWLGWLASAWAIVPVAWTLFDRDRQFLYDRLSGCALVMA